VLIRFNVGNFLSFKDPQEFSMIKGKSEDKPRRLLHTDKLELLKFAAVFGANASGKSNLITAFRFAQKAVVTGVPKKGQSLYFRPDESYAGKPSYFEFEILLGNTGYAYGFEILLEKSEILSEWLFRLDPEGSDKALFIRDVVKGAFYTDLVIASENLRNKFNVYSDDCKQNSEILFLSEMNRAKGELYKEPSELSVFREVYRWFSESLSINYLNRPISDFSYFKDVENKEEVCRVIRSLGTGITGFEEKESSLLEMRQQLPKALYKELEEELDQRIADRARGKKVSSSMTVRIDDMYYIISLEEEQIKVSTVVFHHEGDALFEFHEESEGTRRILDLLEIFFTKEDKVYVIDEIDRSLHPRLTYKFIQEFLNAALKRNIQLIITTHESRLLDLGLLRQDEIWIANKNTAGETELYSLDEYNLRFDKKVDKAYLEGRYGGIPNFSTVFPAKEDNHEDS
jgi:AAA15 family ATPase/GTPase